jgi:hypothetical protein
MTLHEVAKQLGIKGAIALPEKELQEKVAAAIKAVKDNNVKYVFGGKGTATDGKTAIVTKVNMHVSHSVCVSELEDDAYVATRAGEVYFTGEAVPHNVLPNVLKSWIDRNLVMLKEDYDKLVSKAEKKAQDEAPEIKR